MPESRLINNVTSAGDGRSSPFPCFVLVAIIRAAKKATSAMIEEVRYGRTLLVQEATVVMVVGFRTV